MIKIWIAAALTLLLLACADTTLKQPQSAGWKVDFFDDFETFNTANWQDQILWVNDEDHCYVRDNEHNTRWDRAL